MIKQVSKTLLWCGAACALASSQLVSHAVASAADGFAGRIAVPPVESVANKKMLAEIASIRRVVNSAGHVGWDPLGTVVFIVKEGRFIQLNASGRPVPMGKPAHACKLFSAPELAGHVFPVPVGEIPSLEELGCRSVVQRVYKRGHRYIVVQVFGFRSNLGAYAGYSFLRKGSTTVVTRGDGSSEDAQTLSFWQGTHFFRITGTSQEDEESKEVSGKIADQLSAVYNAHSTPPAVLSRLPRLDRVKGSERIVMGPILASKYVSLPAINSLALQSAHCAVLADYQMFHERERLKVLYIVFNNSVSAYQVFDSYFNQLNSLHGARRLTAGLEPSFLFKWNKRYILCQLKPTGQVVVISGARKPRSPVLLAQQIR